MRLAPPCWLALLALTIAVTASADTAWVQHLRDARAALARDDLAAARPALERVDSMVGGHSGAIYALAAIAARSGDRAAALRLLDDYAATGLSRRVTGDTSFAALAGDPGFLAIAARLDSNAAPLARAYVAVRLADAGMLAEDLVWDAKRGRFLVSSIHRRKIVEVTPRGEARDFIAPGADSAWGIYALAIDPVRGRLWATTAASPTCEGFQPADSGRAALLAYDLASARLLARVELPRDGGKHVLGDMTVGPDGTVYLTESLGGAVYRLVPGGKAFETLAPAGTFLNPQMPALTSDRRRLLIPDYPRGLASLEIATGKVAWLGKPRSLASGGIDGFYRTGRTWIAIQNGTAPKRLLELTLDRGETRIESWRVLEQASEWLGEPNHGTLAGRDFWFIGNSGWDRVNQQEEMETPADARPPALLRLSRR